MWLSHWVERALNFGHVESESVPCRFFVSAARRRHTVWRNAASGAKALTIIQIVPRLPPAIDGVGDYALSLASALRSSHGIQTRFVVGDSSWEGEPSVGGCSARCLVANSALAVISSLAESPGVSLVLLHYVGYGYQKRGCPIWLVRGLRGWLSGGKQRRLVTMFHELYAFGPPWRSSFWTSPMQRLLARQMARLSRNCLTNLPQSARVLRGWRGAGCSPVQCLPVFSNVGEPKQVPASGERRPSMIVFGKAPSRRLAYTRHTHDLEQACRTLKLSQVVDIGPGEIDCTNVTLQVVRRGPLNSEQVSNELLRARAGFFTCPAPALEKSGVYAAYAAHGLLPVTFSSNHAENADGLVQSRHWVTADRARYVAADELETVTSSLKKWYAGHALEAQAKRFATLLRSNGEAH